MTLMVIAELEAADVVVEGDEGLVDPYPPDPQLAHAAAVAAMARHFNTRNGIGTFLE